MNLASRVWRIRRAPSRFLQIQRGYRHFERYGETPTSAYRALRQLHVMTNGRFNDWMANRVTREYPRRDITADGVLGVLDQPDIECVTRSIHENGFHIFDRKIDAGTIDSIVEFARNTPAHYILPSQESATYASDAVIFDANHALSPTYWFDAQDLVENETIAGLMGDQSLLAVAQSYLNTEPVLDLVALWWSAPFGGRDKSSSAQMYHFDMDRIKFLKFFVYLTDVDGDTGPHSFVRGSHRRKPGPLLTDGRKTDKQVLSSYSGEEIVEFTGERGTIMAVDTSGLHKGKDLNRGERLVFQIEFAVSMFGRNYPPLQLTPAVSVKLKRLREQMPRVYGALFKE